MTTVQFSINGTPYEVSSDEVPLETNLLTYIRSYAQLRGTKFMCLEGGCGACTVVAVRTNPATKVKETFSVNACLFPLFSAHGLNIVTIEGIGNKDAYHRVQMRLGTFNGIQCGFCSPGMAMNMYGLYTSKNNVVSSSEVEKSFAGNLCRCTGYRPILDAFKSLATDADPMIAKLCADIEDLKVCKKTGKQCAGVCSVKTTQQKLKLTFSNNQTWNKVYTIGEIFDIFRSINNEKYMLVAGNTAHGIYRRSADIEIFIDISSVDELKSYAFGTRIEIGAGVTITDLIKIFNTAASTKPEFQYLLEVNKHLEQIGNLQTRNVGSIAGNLMIKHDHPEFVSDLVLILEIIGATFVVTDIDGRTNEASIQNITTMDMAKRIITKIFVPARSASSFVYRSYKVVPRAQSTPAYVAGAFLFEFNAAKTTVLSAKIGFAGINSKFIRATATELYLVGRNIFTNTILETALESLRGLIEADENPTAGSAEYRNNLALSLFYRFILNISPAGVVRARYLSGGQPLERGISSGKQSFETQPDRYPLSQVMHRVDCFVQAGGETPFSNDLPRFKNELWAAIVQARTINGRITVLDATEALQLDGVEYFICSTDIPGINQFAPSEQLFVTDKVLYNGQAVGMILAESVELANYAATLVKISYNLEDAAQPIYTSIRQVLQADAVDRIRPTSGQIISTQPGNDVQVNVKGEFEMGTQFHFSLEPQTCVAIPAEDGLTLHLSTQYMTYAHEMVSTMLNLPQNRINIETRRIGGGFGSKLTRANFAACIAALGCHVAKVPVRFVMTVEQNMEILGKRNAALIQYNVDVNANGKIQNLNGTFFSDSGCIYTDPSDSHILGTISNCYNTTTWNVNGNSVITNVPSTTYARSPGATEGVAMAEAIMEHISFGTGVDPYNVRLQNILEDSVKTKYSEFATEVNYITRKAEIDLYNTNNRWKKRGITVLPIEYRHSFAGHFKVFVSIYHVDGTVAVSHGGTEMGQGTNTRVCQVVAHTLGIPIFNVAVKPTTSLIGANSASSGGSKSSDSVSVGVLAACKILNERIQPVRNDLPSATWQELMLECNRRNINLSVDYQIPYSDLNNYSVYAFACIEVEADILTGSWLIKRADVTEDVGQSFNPHADVGQIEGGFIMGLGLWTLEQILYDAQGKMLTNRTWNYHPPGANDIPIDFRINFLKGAKNELSPLSSKITGEPPICLSVGIVFALRYAFLAARKDAGGSSVWENMLPPYTIEKNFATGSTDYKNFQL